MLKGSLVALITPMHPDGAIDEKAYAELVDWQIKEGTHGVVAVGTTGESPTLSHQEHRRAVEIAIDVGRGRVPVIAGTGSNSTEEAIALTKHARQAGADAALIVTPYYNKPTQEGLFLHYMAIADAADLSIIIYNIPSRSVVDMSIETMGRLAKHPNIIG
ncbi:MAG: 4-hydroxy-tetrahydrodipicolinate synthase, partial [Acetobacteraceae bacterium]|nr:4-hydroxy-tetrahydrodipicolinate synthase [Acetobacteraceae bacterium]